MEHECKGSQSFLGWKLGEAETEAFIQIHSFTNRFLLSNGALAGNPFPNSFPFR